MSDLLKQAAKPQLDLTRLRYPSDFTFCPNCGKPKSRKSKRCAQCATSQTRPPIDNNVYTEGGIDFRKISGTQGKYILVDKDDYERLSNALWHIRVSQKGKPSEKFYAYTWMTDRNVAMHRFILDVWDDREVDHINNNGIDNRRFNLRLCSHPQNQFNRHVLSTNTSGYRGVVLDKTSGKWKAAIGHDNKLVNLGYFDDPTEAAKARDKAAVEHHGKFARLNFPPK